MISQIQAEENTRMIVDRAREESIMYDQLQNAIDLDSHGITFVFTDSAEKTAKVRSLAEKRLCLAPHGSFESANRDLLDTNCGGIVLDLGLIHDLTPQMVGQLLETALYVARKREFPVVIIAPNSKRNLLRQTNAWELRTIVFDFDNM